jgi:hypothetical protein
VKGWKKTFQANGPQNQAGVGILTSEKVDFKFKLVKKENKSHFTIIKGSIHQRK